MFHYDWKVSFYNRAMFHYDWKVSFYNRAMFHYDWKVSLTIGQCFIINEAMFNLQYRKVQMSKCQIFSYESQPKFLQHLADIFVCKSTLLFLWCGLEFTYKTMLNHMET